MSDWDRYIAAAHKVQSGVAALIGYRGDEFAGATPKHLRVGVDLRAVEHGALVKLLIAKGVFTMGEFEEALADAAEKEADRYRDAVREELGSDSIKLG